MYCIIVSSNGGELDGLQKLVNRGITMLLIAITLVNVEKMSEIAGAAFSRGREERDRGERKKRERGEREY